MGSRRIYRHRRIETSTASNERTATIVAQFPDRFLGQALASIDTLRSVASYIQFCYIDILPMAKACCSWDCHGDRIRKPPYLPMETPRGFTETWLTRNSYCSSVNCMLKRVFRGSQPSATRRNLTRLDLIEALQHPGCALCYLAQQKSQRYVETLLDNAVTDVDQRDAWRHAKGFCHWHAWMAITVPQASGSLAILYADVLRHETEHLATLRTALRPARCQPWLSRRLLAKRVQHWLSVWQQRHACPACRLWHEQEQLCIAVLLGDWHDPTLQAAFTQSSGLCVLHIARLIAHGTTHTHLPAFLTAQQEHLQALQAELQEFIRKLDYRFAREPYGSEADAWQRVVALFVGIPGWHNATSSPSPDDC